MKIPRDIGANELIRKLSQHRYTVSRQTGCHIRLTTNKNGQHHITIPNHNPLKIGTLSAIPSDVAEHFGQTKESLLQTFWG